MSSRRRLLAALPVALLAALPATGLAGPSEPGDKGPMSAAAVALVAGNRAFACDLFKVLAAKPGNLFFSPHSVTSALAMTRAGAMGETAKQMDAVLHLPSQASSAYRELVTALTTVRDLDEYTNEGRTKVPAYALSIANGLFTQKGWTFLDPFRKTVADDFHAEFRELEFANGPAAREEINHWVEDKTKGRIKDIVPAGLPTSDTRMVLANAIHFKAQWEKAFSESLTADGPFTVAVGREATARRMKRQDHLAYAKTPTAQLLELPYRGGDTSMVVILPDAKDGIDALIGSLSGEALGTWIGSLERKLVALELPRFTFTSTADLAAPLVGLGMKAAFGPSTADFAGITPEKPLFIGAVLHKAFVAVDEKGTEAAAATVVIMRAGAARPRPEDPIPFVVDHPFLFLIRHTATGEILFLGRVHDPTAGS